MHIVTHYREREDLRGSFNALARATFGLDFEPWYRMGWWTDNYQPYSIWEDGKIVASVSLNRTDLVIEGRRREIYQLGTVMTDPAYRNRGYIRTLMAKIEEDIAGADGVYLFANDSVRAFYPKFGFEKTREFCHSRPVSQTASRTMAPVKMDTPENRARLAKAMAESTFPGGCAMVDNPGLIFFYAAQFLQENVYFCEALDCWAIAEEDDGVLTLHAVFGTAALSLDEVIAAFGSSVREAVLGFSPADPHGWVCRELLEEDTTFFTKGEAFRDFGEKRLRIPTLAHA